MILVQIEVFQSLTENCLYRDEAKNRQIEKILQHRQKDQANLVMSLLEEESWQYQAFSSLLSHRDRRIALLSQDIQAVVDQLNQLTSWELQRKNRQVDNANVSCDNNSNHTRGVAITSLFSIFFPQL